MVATDFDALNASESFGRQRCLNLAKAGGEKQKPCPEQCART